MGGTRRRRWTVSEERIGPEYYDREGYFDEGTGHITDPGSAFQRYRVEKVLEIHHPNHDARVLDLGCGWGTFSLALAPRVREVVGVDFSERSIELCRQRARELRLRNVSFVRADAADTGLDAESFDVVVAADLVEHLYPQQTVEALEEVRRVLKGGGRLVIWTPNRGHFIEILKHRAIVLRPDPTHVDYKSMETLHGLLVEIGFDVEKAYYAESHLPVLRTLERALLWSVPFLRRRIAILARRR